MDGPAAPPVLPDYAATRTGRRDAAGCPACPPAGWAARTAGPKGIWVDFNRGWRAVAPERAWRLRLRDLDTGDIPAQSENTGAFVGSAKRWLVRFRVDVGPRLARLPTRRRRRGTDVLIRFPRGTLGWFPYEVRFQHPCRLTCAMSVLIIPPMPAPCRHAAPDLMPQPQHSTEQSP